MGCIWRQNMEIKIRIGARGVNEMWIEIKIERRDRIPWIRIDLSSSRPVKSLPSLL